MILADTGPLVAVANSRDQHHNTCRVLLESHSGEHLYGEQLAPAKGITA